MIPLFTRCAIGSNRSRTAIGGALIRGSLALALGAGTVLLSTPAHADAVRDAQWHLGLLKLVEAHNLTKGEGVTVAVISSGVDANHPDLRGNVLPGVDAWDVDSPAKGHKDVLGHGTGVASLIAGHGHGPGNSEGVLGIAPKAKILPINVKNPTRLAIDPDNIAAGIEYAAQAGAKVICVTVGEHDSARRQEIAVDRARARGALVIAAASGLGLAVDHPAAYEGTVSVAATGRNGGTLRNSPSGETIDLAAPGADLTMAQPGGGYWKSSGTSGAAAIVAGTAALVRAKHPDSDPALLANRLMRNTVDKGEPGHDWDYGWGMLDVMAALTQAPSSPQPTESPENLWPADAPSSEINPKFNWWSLVEASWILQVFLGVIAALAIWLRRRIRQRPTSPQPPPSTAQPPVPQPVPDNTRQRPPGAAPPPPGPPQRRE